jgi:tetratricopeptide (TPR) repeat protein
MPVSMYQTDRRTCPACQAEVVSDLWLIVHRHERPELWKRAPSLHILECPNGHRGPVRAPLLLFDPSCPFVIFVPAVGRSPADARSDGDLLMGSLWAALPPHQRRSDLRVEMVPRDLLPALLSTPEINFGEIAPGLPHSKEGVRIISEICAGRASVAGLHKLAGDATVPLALQAAIRFELAQRLCREACDGRRGIEEAMTEWDEVIRLYPRAIEPRRWAIACMELAHCYTLTREGDRATNLREALRLLDESLEVLTVERYAEDFALAQSRRGDLFLDMDEGISLIDQSLSAYQAALTVYSRRSYPYDWALVLSNMATAYLTRGETSGFDDIRTAISVLEQALEIRTREAMPSEWALTQMNLGLALSRLPEAEDRDPRGHAIEAFRGACEVFRELKDHLRHTQASFNLGITLARSGDPSLAREAIERLEETLPWLLTSTYAGQASDALDCLSNAYTAWLQSEPDSGQADTIVRRALVTFEKCVDLAATIKTYGQVGLWLLTNSQGHPDRLQLAGLAFERILEATTDPRLAEMRAATLGNLATVLLLRQDGLERARRERASSCIEEAVRILRSLPSTPKRDEQIGRLIANQTLSGLWTEHPNS